MKLGANAAKIGMTVDENLAGIELDVDDDHDHADLDGRS